MRRQADCHWRRLHSLDDVGKEIFAGLGRSCIILVQAFLGDPLWDHRGEEVDELVLSVDSIGNLVASASNDYSDQTIRLITPYLPSVAHEIFRSDVAPDFHLFPILIRF